MPINTKSQYVEIGTAVTGSAGSYVLTNSISIPAPHAVPSTNKYKVAADTTAGGTVVAQLVGRANYHTTLKWDVLSNRDYWRINRWFRDHGQFFYMRYFSQTDGAVKIQRFYRDDAQEAQPSEKQEIIGTLSVPAYYKNFSFKVHDFGDTVITESEVTIS